MHQAVQDIGDLHTILSSGVNAFPHAHSAPSVVITKHKRDIQQDSRIFSVCTHAAKKKNNEEDKKCLQVTS